MQPLLRRALIRQWQHIFAVNRVRIFSCTSSLKFDNVESALKHENAAASKWEALIGLEIHAQLLSSSKLFSVASTAKTFRSNKHVALFDLATPGTLPVLNDECVKLGIRAALALLCSISPESRFERKHYVYHDLPHGYQITQQKDPLAKNGKLVLHKSDGVTETVTIPIAQIQLEQDSAKTLVDPVSSRLDCLFNGLQETGSIEASHCSLLVDYNRAGMALIEIVTEPSIRSGKEAALVVKKVQRLLQDLAVCDGSMEDGSLRCDANVSLVRRNENGDVLGRTERTEMKNLSPIRAVHLGIEAELERQLALVKVKGEIQRATYTFDLNTKELLLLRTKESSAQYRFLPEWDLPPLRISPSRIIAVQQSLPMTSETKRDKLLPMFTNPAEPNLLETHLGNLLDQPDIYYRYFCELTEQSCSFPIYLAYQWLLEHFAGLLNTLEMSLDQMVLERLPPADFRQLLLHIQDGSLAPLHAKHIIRNILLDPKANFETCLSSLLPSVNSDNLTLQLTQFVLDHDAYIPSLSDEQRRKKLLNGLFRKFLQFSYKGPTVDPRLVHRLFMKAVEEHSKKS